jgi:hypothetical protein
MRKRHIVGLLELACQELELPKTRFEAAKTAYESVGDWLANCPDTGKYAPRIFPQGSMALGTTVRPLEREEFDVDLVCHFQKLDTRSPQAEVKTAVGDRLKGYEAGLGPTLEEYKRCWRLNYSDAAKLHLDITPAVHNPTCGNGGLAVTDKEKRRWEPTHPEGYVKWFKDRADLQPDIRSQITEFSAKAASVEPLPENEPFKSLLKRAVQLLKRHRSIRFAKIPDVAPISVIITTLTARAYEDICVRREIFDTEFDLLLAVVERLHIYIEKRTGVLGQVELWVPNATTDGENFAEKWNKNAALPNAFFQWQADARKDFGALAEAQDAEELYEALEKCVGVRTTGSVRSSVTERISRARSASVLRADSRGRVNLTAGAGVAANTFFGR